MTVKELKGMAKEAGIKGYSHMNKLELLEALENMEQVKELEQVETVETVKELEQVETVETVKELDMEQVKELEQMRETLEKLKELETVETVKDATIAPMISGAIIDSLIVEDTVKTATDLKEVCAFAAAISLLDVDRMTDDTACGGAIGDYWVTLRDSKRHMLASYPLALEHSRFVPADMYGGTPRTAASLYQQADSEALASGRYHAFVGLDGAIYHVKGSVSGKPYAQKLTLKRWRDTYLHKLEDSISRMVHGRRVASAIRNITYTVAVEHDIEHK